MGLLRLNTANSISKSQEIYVFWLITVKLKFALFIAETLCLTPRHQGPKLTREKMNLCCIFCNFVLELTQKECRSNVYKPKNYQRFYKKQN
jgi:hypothetical protein